MNSGGPSRDNDCRKPLVSGNEATDSDSIAEQSGDVRGMSETPRTSIVSPIEVFGERFEDGRSTRR